LSNFKSRHWKGGEDCVCGHSRFYHDHGWKMIFGKGECDDCTCTGFKEKIVICKRCKRERKQREVTSFNKECKDRDICSEFYMKDVRDRLK